MTPLVIVMIILAVLAVSWFIFLVLYIPTFMAKTSALKYQLKLMDDMLEQQAGDRRPTQDQRSTRHGPVL